MKKQCEARNLTMVMDLYELTMANGYFRQGRINEKVYYKYPLRGDLVCVSCHRRICRAAPLLRCERERLVLQ